MFTVENKNQTDVLYNCFRSRLELIEDTHKNKETRQVYINGYSHLHQFIHMCV